MAKSSSENYLDNLLNSINYDLKDGPDMDLEGDQTDEDFLSQFESELESEEYTSYIEEFENELEMDRSSGSSVPEVESAIESEPLAPDESLEEVLASISEESAEDSPANDEESLGSLEDLDVAMESFGEEENQAEDKLEEPLSLDELGAIDSVEDLGMVDLGLDTGIEADEYGEPDLAGNSGEDLMDMLGESEDLSDLSDLLGEEGGSQEALDAIESYAEGQMEAESSDSDRDDSDESGAEKKKGKKGGFFAKLAGLLFGADEDEDNSVKLSAEISDGATVAELSEENQQLLKELENESKEEKGKKGKKEKKKKEPKPKKEKKPKAKKEPKPKKEKKPKEKDNTPPLPKKPVFLIILMIASMVALVLITVKLSAYNGNIIEAKALYNNHTPKSYTMAYIDLEGMELKEADMELYSKLKILAAVSSEYDNFEVFHENKREIFAFDSLVCAAGRYNVNLEAAEALGCVEEYQGLRTIIEQKLGEVYKISFDEALELYNSKNRDVYSEKLHTKLAELGLE